MDRLSLLLNKPEQAQFDQPRVKRQATLASQGRASSILVAVGDRGHVLSDVGPRVPVPLGPAEAGTQTS